MNDQYLDPAAREWRRSFEYHLDIVPPLMEILVWMTIPSIPVSRGGSQFDRPQVTGGGFVDNVPVIDTGRGPEADATFMWEWLVAYTRAVTAWITPHRPAPVLPDTPDADPLTARSLSLVTVGWLIDHADLVRAVDELEQSREEMFATIRQLRGRYGVFPRPRRPRARCGLCGVVAVVVDWVTGEGGTARPVQVARCKACGDVTFPAGEGEMTTNNPKGDRDG